MIQNENKFDQIFNLSISKSTGSCAIGEKIGKLNLEQKKIPVISCEGACIRGEIARLTANYVAKNKGYQRGCHGEIFTMPNSQIAQWILNAEKIICIDGCFLKCHSRVLKNLINPSRLMVFDALSYYKKYNEFFYIDDVSEQERKEVALKVASKILTSLEAPDISQK